jgi:hypothetical protein
MKIAMPAAEPDIELLIVSNHSAAPSRVAFYLSVMAVDGQIADYDCLLEVPTDIPEDLPEFEEVKNMRLGHKFPIWGPSARTAVSQICEQLYMEYGNRVKIIKPWFRSSKTVTVKVE